jgi:hypothetical protein
VLGAVCIHCNFKCSFSRDLRWVLFFVHYIVKCRFWRDLCLVMFCVHHIVIGSIWRDLFRCCLYMSYF